MPTIFDPPRTLIVDDLDANDELKHGLVERINRSCFLETKTYDGKPEYKRQAGDAFHLRKSLGHEEAEVHLVTEHEPSYNHNFPALTALRTS